MPTTDPEKGDKLLDEKNGGGGGDDEEWSESDSSEDYFLRGVTYQGRMALIGGVSAGAVVLGVLLVSYLAPNLSFGAAQATAALSSGSDKVDAGDPVLVGEEELLGASSNSSLDCWTPCNGAGNCPGYCGVQSACCRTGDMLDPPICAGAKLPSPPLPYHTCVAVSQAAAAYSPTPTFLTKEATQAAAGELSSPFWSFSSASDDGAAPALAPFPAPAPLPLAPVFKFYVYRAQNDNEYPLGNVNVANMPGVMWYLNNEVMPRCPKRYHISRIKRMVITMQATPELYAKGMNFGVRYSFDAGKCTGSNIRWLGACDLTWNKYGYVPGCNNFKDHYPYPLIDTEYPNGIWYSLPVEGRCDNPNGTANCTWSYQEAGEISLSDLEMEDPGHAWCCEGNCTNFWWDHWGSQKCQKRVALAMDMFAKKYPDMPLDMPTPPCDFIHDGYWD